MPYVCVLLCLHSVMLHSPFYRCLLSSDEAVFLGGDSGSGIRCLKSSVMLYSSVAILAVLPFHKVSTVPSQTLLVVTPDHHVGQIAQSNVTDATRNK